MNRDRGAIKWTSMMLPEHVEQLKVMAEKQHKKTPPTVDYQLFEEWSRLLAEAYHDELMLSVTIIKDGFEEVFHGYIHRIDPLNRNLTLEDASRSERTILSLHAITEIHIE